MDRHDQYRDAIKGQPSLWRWVLGTHRPQVLHMQPVWGGLRGAQSLEHFRIILVLDPDPESTFTSCLCFGVATAKRVTSRNPHDAPAMQELATPISWSQVCLVVS